MKIEPLESRIAPASVLTFTDIDGDVVKITSTLGDLNAAGVATLVDVDLGKQLRVLDLRDLSFQGASISTSVVKKGAGDGLVNIGSINATGRDLGTVTIGGDLGQIDCGDANGATTGLQSLIVRSLGRYSLVTQGAVGDLTSSIVGRLGALKVAGDMQGAVVNAEDSTTPANGTIGSVTIGGSLIGANFGLSTGAIFSSGDMGPVKIGGDLLGGALMNAGVIRSTGAIASVSIGGSMIGGPGSGSGRIFAEDGLGPVQIGADFLGGTGDSSARISTDGSITSLRVGGSMIGGTGPGSSLVNAQDEIGAVTIGGNFIGGGNGAGSFVAGKIASVSIGGSLIAGSGPGSGTIYGDTRIGPIRIGHDMRGGAFEDSGRIAVEGALDSLTIGGSLVGGAGTYFTGNNQPAQVYAKTSIGPVKIGGDLVGGAGFGSGAIVAGLSSDATIKIGTVSIGGSIFGGAGGSSGLVSSSGSLGAVTIGGSIVGGVGSSSGAVSANGTTLPKVTIGGSLIGGGDNTTISSGFIFSRGDMGTVTIGGDVLGGGGDEGSGVIFSLGKLDRVSIGGSLAGGAGTGSGAISSGGTMGAVTIGGDFLGGSLPGQTASLSSSGSIVSSDRIGSITIGGSIIAGVDSSGGGDLIDGATIRAVHDIGSLTVRGDIVGNVNPQGDSLVTISARGQAVPGTNSDMAIGKISVGGRVEWAKIFAGYNPSLAPVNANAQIGPVTVGTDWIASSLVAGVMNLGADNAVGGGDDNVNFGDFHDAKIAVTSADIVAKITSITIAGQVYGTPNSARPNDSFGFVSEQIGAFKVGARTFTLDPGAGNDGTWVVVRSDGLLADVTLHEAGALIGSTSVAGTGAKLVGKTTVTYTDSDGDFVTVKLSKPLLTAGNVGSVFVFDTGAVNDGLPARQQLRFLNIATLATNGIGITVTVTPGGQGDGLAHVGYINAFEFDLGAVSIPGDLNQIQAGDANLATLGVASLTIRTMGRLGVDTQLPASAPEPGADIEGGLGALVVKQDLTDAFLNVNGPIGSVTIGGSLIGDYLDNRGRISAAGKIGAVKIGHHLQGGFGQRTGAIDNADGDIVSVSIGGSLLGGAGMFSGRIRSGDDLGPVTIGRNLRGGTNSHTGELDGDNDIGAVTIGGSLLGGRGDMSAFLTAEGTVGPVKITHNLVGGANDAGRIFCIDVTSLTLGGSLVGGVGANSGTVTTLGDSALATDGKIGAVRIGGSVLGGAGADSGKIDAEGRIASVSIGGSVAGGSGDQERVAGTFIHRGQIYSQGDIGSVTIGGNLLGGGGILSGSVFAFGKISRVGIGGSILGSDGVFSGNLYSSGELGPVTIRHDVSGVGSGSAEVGSDTRVVSVNLGGSLIGGTGAGGGRILSEGGLGSITIGLDVIGGGSSSDGVVSCNSRLTSVTIGGSLFGGRASFTGNIFAGDIGSVKIGRNLVGASIAGTAANIEATGYIFSQDGIDSVAIGGSIFAGFDTSTVGDLTTNASIRAGDDLGAVTVRGSLVGHEASNSITRVIISARGQATPGATDVAIASLTVGGRVERAAIFGGVTTTLTPANANAVIGPVKVGGNWIASDLTAPKRIASIAIGGIVIGGPNTGFDFFEFRAAQIGSFKSLNFTAPLTPGTDAPIALSPTTGDVAITEA